MFPAELDLPLIWAFLIAFAVLAYVVLDGFDLGVGLLFPFLADDGERTLAMNSIAPVWDGNETWLVLGGGGLLAVFPLAYAILLPAFYAPIIAMLLGLVARGVAFEFRFRSRNNRTFWERAFTIGSAIAAIAQGLMLGTIVQGVKVQGRAYAGGWFDWFTPFSVLCAAAVVIGYALLGATWLIWKTEGPLQERAHRFALPLTACLLGAIVLVSAWTPFLNPTFLRRWFSKPAIFYVAPVPLVTLGLAAQLVAAVRDKRDATPFLATLGLFVITFVGLGISLYPMIVPPSVSIWDAAAPDKSLAFLLVGAVILVPLILAYTAYAYWVFRGKVSGEGYHG